MPIVLSLLPTKPVPGLVENHASYARQHGYRHVVIDGTHIYGERQQTLHRYHCIYQQLLSLPDGDQLLVLDVFSLIYTPHPLEAVAHGYDSLVTMRNPTLRPDLANSSGMLFRSTAAIREKLYALVQEIGKWATYMPEQAQKLEAQILGKIFPPISFIHHLENGYAFCIHGMWQGHDSNTTWALDSIPLARPLVASQAPEWIHINGVWAPTPDYDFRYVQALLLMAQSSGSTTQSLSEIFEQHSLSPQAPELHINPDAEIAFVSLFTPNIAGYGILHERSMLRYCERHGYGYHLYREAPAFLPGSVTANWAKAHLIRKHLKQHQFVLWIDADILAVQQASGMEKLLSGRDFITGMDHTAWAINSCIFGARNTPQMQAFVEQLCQRIEEVQDKSSIYASGGDQQILNEEMIQAGLLNANHVVDALSLGTSPIYATPEHRFVHFPMQINHYRAASMQVWEQLSQ